MNLLRVCWLLVKLGLKHSIAAACLRQQLLCEVRIKLGHDYAHIGERTIGCLTGSRVAGIAARVPILHMCSERGALWMKDGFITPAGTLTVSTFVDNVFAAGKSCAGVTRILDDVEDFLSKQWDLQIKTSSRAVLAPAKSNDLSVTDEHKWPVVTQMKVLGTWVQNDGGIETCFAEALTSIWRAFFANCAGANVHGLPLRRKLDMVQRAVSPILRFKWTRWPFVAYRAGHLDSVQRKMFSIILGLRPGVGETMQQFVRRRGRSVGELQRQQGPWSTQWARAIVAWSEHLYRDRNANTWAAMVAKHRTPEELAERRAFFSQRPCTRSSGGYIKKRWFESVFDAASRVKT